MSSTVALAVEHVAIDALRPDPANPRRIGEAELDALTRSLAEFGFVQPVVARRDDATVIAGHQRLVAARRHGIASVPVVWVDLPPERARLLGLALNKTGGDWDERLLARLMADLGAQTGLDLGLSGFDEDEIRNLLRGLEAREKRARPEGFDLEAALAAASRRPRAKAGDLWLLGDHRLLCGDAARQVDVDRLLDGARPAMAFCDPPYNVDLGHHGGRRRGTRRRTITNDDLDPATWDAFVTAWASTLLASTDGAIYVCMSSKEWPTVAARLAAAGGHWSDTIIWAKDRFVLGRADYQRAYEPIWYGWREGGKRHWGGDRDQSDVWQIDRPIDAPLHPVMKPLGLMERAITNSSRPGDAVLDLFGGSGSTLVACERTARTCRMLELDPVYVEVILARWETFTGQTAVRSGG